MKSYQHLRDVWADELERHGEIDRLSRTELRLLDRGSLEVLAATRLRAIGRKRRWFGALPFTRPRLDASEQLYRRLRAIRRKLTEELLG